MPIPPIPLDRILVPSEIPKSPGGATVVDAALTGGLPAFLPLEAEWRLALVLSTGLARTWREADPRALVTRSEDDLVPFDPENPSRKEARPAARLLLQKAGITQAVLPLVLGPPRRVPDSGLENEGTRFEVTILGWEIRAGNVRGPGEFGSRLRLAWQRADRAVADYSTPPPHPHLVPRLPIRERLETLRVQAEIRFALAARFRLAKVMPHEFVVPQRVVGKTVDR